MEIVPAVSADQNAPYWEVLPAYTRITLKGYPINRHDIRPQTFVYPVNELTEINKNVDKMVED